MPILRRSWPLVVVVAALVFGGWSRREASYAKAESRRLSGVVDSLAKVARGRDTLYVTQTRTLTKWRDSLVVQRESLTITDTVEVIRFIAAQDSTINACLSVVQTCEARIADRDAQLAAFQAKARADLAVVQSRVPSFVDRVRSAVVFAGAGYLVGRLTP